MTVAEMIEELKNMPQDLEVNIWTCNQIEIEHIVGSEQVEDCVMIIPLKGRNI